MFEYIYNASLEKESGTPDLRGAGPHEEHYQSQRMSLPRSSTETTAGAFMFVRIWASVFILDCIDLFVLVYCI